MEPKQLGENIELSGKEEDLLEDLREIELNNRNLSYEADTLLKDVQTTSDISLSDGDLNNLANYLEKVRTQNGYWEDQDYKNPRNPINYNIEQTEEGIRAEMIYDHPTGTVISEITGEFSESSIYKIDETLGDD